MFQFPLDNLMDEDACYAFLLQTLHPDGLQCPHGHPLPLNQAPHDRHRAPIVDYRCRKCGAVFNLFTGTIWWKTRYRCSTIVQIMRGIAQGVPTKHLAAELGINRTHLLERRHQIQTLVAARLSPLRPITGRGDGSRRTIPKCGREGPQTPLSRRSAPPARQ